LFLHYGALRNHDVAVRHFLSEARTPWSEKMQSEKPRTSVSRL
jgi:hypothetical protein